MSALPLDPIKQIFNAKKEENSIIYIGRQEMRERKEMREMREVREV
jgi:ATP:corrinoid adenosyltransferase